MLVCSLGRLLVTLPALRTGSLPVCCIRGGDAAAQVEVYTTPGCRFCTRAKGFLRRRGVPFEELDVSESEATLNEMIARASRATLPQIFVGGDHIGGCDDLLQENESGKLATRLEALGVAMLEEEAPVEDATGFADDAPTARRDGRSILNARIVGAADLVGDAASISTDLQKQMLRLMDAHLSDDGSRVDYAALRVSPAFAAFLDTAGELTVLPEAALDASAPVDERKAFWINLYNCLVLHATAVMGAPTDADGRTAFFTGASGGAYCVAGHRFSLDDIEHGVLRANSPTVGGATLFAAGDPRLAFAMAEVDPRVHFALNCGARSCPPIKFYQPARLDESLDLSARSFLEADLAVDGPTLTCTKLLDWYGPDFGPDARAVVERVRSLLPAATPLHESLGGALGAPAGVSLEFRPYDWGSNDENADASGG